LILSRTSARGSADQVREFFAVRKIPDITVQLKRTTTNPKKRPPPEAVNGLPLQRESSIFDSTMDAEIFLSHSRSNDFCGRKGNLRYQKNVKFCANVTTNDEFLLLRQLDFN
jgi:hypothetical protein